MRVAPTGPARADETPRCSYVTAEKLTDGSILRIQPSTPPTGDETPSCVVTAQQLAPRARPDERLRFGDWLVRRGLIDRAQLFDALCRAQRRGQRLGDALVDLALLQRKDVEEEASFFDIFSTWGRQ